MNFLKDLLILALKDQWSPFDQQLLQESMELLFQDAYKSLKVHLDYFIDPWNPFNDQNNLS